MKKIVNVDELHIGMKGMESIREYKERIIEKWVYRNFNNVKLEHEWDYSVLTDCTGKKMKITYTNEGLELEYD